MKVKGSSYSKETMASGVGMTKLKPGLKLEIFILKGLEQKGSGEALSGSLNHMNLQVLTRQCAFSDQMELMNE